MHILSPGTDNWPSWISGRGRMAVENISWSISTKECCRPRTVVPRYRKKKRWELYNIGIKHVFLYINIRQVPREVLKTEAGGRGFQHLPRDLLMHWKTMFDRYYCIKTENICYISRYFLHYFVLPLFCLFTDVSRTQFPRTMLVLGPGSTHLVTAANLWPRYDHIESCVAVH